MAILGKSKEKKAKENDGHIDTAKELLEMEHEELWKQNPLEALKYEKIETRKRLNWWARFILSMIIVMTFLFLVWLLFMADLPQASRDLINIMVGAYVAVLAKATDFWFKDKEDAEHKESADAAANGNGNGNGNTDQQTY